LDQIRRNEVALHEMGHTLGLQHTTRDAAMCGNVSSVGPCSVGVQRDRFRAWEELLIRLLFQRLVGNRFPDNDRGVSDQRARGQRSLCSLPETS
jgi:hypothetical protein